MEQRLKGYRNVNPWKRTQLSAWIEFGVKGEGGSNECSDYTEFYLYFFRKSLLFGGEELCFQATTTT